MKIKYENKAEDVQKFIDAQNTVWGGEKKCTMYEKALEEIKSGNKQEHWIWYVWPQLEGLGHSRHSKVYGIPGLEGALVYLKNKMLHDRLIEISEALVGLETDDLMSVMWEIDCLKVRSSITMFYRAAVVLFGQDSKEADLFMKIRDKFFSRIGFCELTLEMLEEERKNK